MIIPQIKERALFSYYYFEEQFRKSSCLHPCRYCIMNIQLGYNEFDDVCSLVWNNPFIMNAPSYFRYKYYPSKTLPNGYLIF